MAIDSNPQRGAEGRAAADPAAILYDLGVSYSTGTGGKPLDLVEAHLCFNLAARSGSGEAAAARAELADAMSASEIVAAQRRARAWRGAPAAAGVR